MARWTLVGGKLIPVTGPPGPGLSWRGTWDSTTAYQRYDIVHYQGNTFIATVDNIDSQPSADAATPNLDWDVFLEGGTGGGASGDEDSLYIQSADTTSWRIFINNDGVLETEVVVE